MGRKENKRYLIVIVGWHFLDNSFYEAIVKLIKDKSNTEALIISHKKKEDVPAHFLEYISNSNRIEIQFFDNIGYDWGAYSQAFAYLGDKIFNYEYICFTQDDIDIVDNNFLDIFSSNIEKNNLKVLGNSANPIDYPFKDSHPQVIEWAHLAWDINIKSEKWSTVRGSFFVVKSEIFKKIKKIPYRNGHHVGFGNWGVIVFGGLVSDLYGPNSLKTISSEDLVSPYIREYRRGIKPEISQRELADSSNVVKIDLKVHFGCGNDYWDGYLNLDQTDNSLADVVADISKIEFKNDSISELVMNSVIQHLNKYDAESILAKIYSWLKPGGSLIIECPDILKISKSIVKNRKRFSELEDSLNCIKGLYGESTNNLSPYEHFKWGYSEYTLSTKLKNAGFTKIKNEDPVSSKSSKKRDLRVIGVK